LRDNDNFSHLYKKTAAETQAPRQLHVGVITTSFPVTDGSSSGIFIERLISHIAAREIVTVLVPCPEDKIDQLRGNSYDIKCFRYGPPRWLSLAHRPGGIPDAIRRRDPAIGLLPLLIFTMFMASLRVAGKVDIIHGNWSIPGLVGAVAAKLRGRPSIVTVRGEDVNRANRSKLFKLVLWACLSMNRYTVVVSEAMRDLLIKQFPGKSDRIVFIPNGVSVAESSNRPAYRSPLRLLTVSSLIRRKRIESLIEMVRHLADIGNVVLRIVGDGPERQNLEGITKRLHLQDNIQFVGAVAPEMVEQQLFWADIFVFSSESEGRPNVILEAMAAGLPVVATDIPGVHELLYPDCGLLVPVGDTIGLARSIMILASNPNEGRHLGDNARARIEDSDLTWVNSARCYESVYLAAIHGNGYRQCVD
jgi:glycosyltransferase involved in cell wall biosynthesis